MTLDFWPTRGGQNQNGNFSSGEILLVLKIFVGRDEQVKFRLGFAEQVAVAQIRPAFFKGSGDGVFGECAAERSGRSLVEKNFHATTSARDQAGLGEFQNRFHLLAGDAGKPVKKIVHACARLDVFKQGIHWHAGVFENPRAADLGGVAFHRRALAPVEHDETIRRFNLSGKGQRR